MLAAAPAGSTPNTFLNPLTNLAIPVVPFVALAIFAGKVIAVVEAALLFAQLDACVSANVLVLALIIAPVAAFFFFLAIPLNTFARL